MTQRDRASRPGLRAAVSLRGAGGAVLILLDRLDHHVGTQIPQRRKTPVDQQVVQPAERLEQLQQTSLAQEIGHALPRTQVEIAKSDSRESLAEEGEVGQGQLLLVRRARRLGGEGELPVEPLEEAV